MKRLKLCWKRLILTSVTILLVLFMSSCGNGKTNVQDPAENQSANSESQTDRESEAAEKTDELLPEDDEEADSLSDGGWVSSDQKSVLIFHEDGPGAIISRSPDSGSSLMTDMTWTETESRITITSTFGVLDVKQKTEDKELILQIGSKTYHSIDESEINAYIEEAEKQKDDRKKAEQEAEKESANLYELKQMGDSVDVGFATLTFEDIGVSDELYPADTSGSYLYFEDESGYKYVYLKGRIKNTGSEDIDSRYVKGNILINEIYDYETVMTIMANPSSITDFAIRPFEEAMYYVYASIPEDAVTVKTDGSIHLSFNDGFKAGNEPAQYNYEFVF